MALTLGLLASSALFYGASAAGTAGCGKSHSTGYHNNGGSGYVVQSGGLNRTYTINIPSNYNNSAATGVIISYHGNGGTSDGQSSLTQFGNETWNPNLISVFPQGYKGHWQGPAYAVAGIDDVQFTKDLVSHLEADYCVDTTRIYASGKSNGGGFVDTLACSSAANLFAAYTSCSGAFYTDNQYNHTDCTATNKPYLEFHGSIDDVIPYDGVSKSSGTTPPIPIWLSYWSQRNNCTSSSNTFLYNNVVNHTVYSCPSSSPLEAYWIKGMGHSWPSTSNNSDNQAHGDGSTVLDATPLIIAFYNKFPLQGSNNRSTSSNSPSTSGVQTSTTTSGSTRAFSATCGLLTWISPLFFVLAALALLV